MFGKLSPICGSLLPSCTSPVPSPASASPLNDAIPDTAAAAGSVEDVPGAVVTGPVLVGGEGEAFEVAAPEVTDVAADVPLLQPNAPPPRQASRQIAMRQAVSTALRRRSIVLLPLAFPDSW